jgi:hypothetical protein
MESARRCGFCSSSLEHEDALVAVRRGPRAAVAAPPASSSEEAHQLVLGVGSEPFRRRAASSRNRAKVPEVEDAHSYDAMHFDICCASHGGTSSKRCRYSNMPPNTATSTPIPARSGNGRCRGSTTKVPGPRSTRSDGMHVPPHPPPRRSRYLAVQTAACPKDCVRADGWGMGNSAGLAVPHQQVAVGRGSRWGHHGPPARFDLRAAPARDTGRRCRRETSTLPCGPTRRWLRRPAARGRRARWRCPGVCPCR